MAEHARIDELREAERRLQAAQLAGDVAALDQLLDDRLIFTYGPGTGVTWFLGVLEGTLAGAPFAARLRYTRTWIHDDDRGWRVVAAHASPGRPPTRQ
ncbi:MAG: nuclear transport factor 2 family protein [Pseudonocardia sp.]